MFTASIVGYTTSVATALVSLVYLLSGLSRGTKRDWSRVFGGLAGLLMSISFFVQTMESPLSLPGPYTSVPYIPSPLAEHLFRAALITGVIAIAIYCYENRVVGMRWLGFYLSGSVSKASDNPYLSSTDKQD